MKIRRQIRLRQQQTKTITKILNRKIIKCKYILKPMNECHEFKNCILLFTLSLILLLSFQRSQYTRTQIHTHTQEFKNQSSRVESSGLYFTKITKKIKKFFFSFSLCLQTNKQQ